MIEVLSQSKAAREWLERAASDFVSARALIPIGQHGDAAFFSQQAAEKAIKGFLTWHDIPFPKTHFIDALRLLLVPVDAEFAQIVSEADQLTDYAWEFRYPGISEEATEALAREALRLAEVVYNAVLTRVPREAHPQG